jgi:site-specific DNA-methyltransferase (adenine-specific)
MIWVKNISINENLSYGHYKPINSDRYLNDCWEFIFHFTLNGDTQIDRKAVGVGYTDKSNLKRWKTATNKRCRGNVIYIPYKTVQSKKKHPAAFPPALPEHCIKLHGLKNGLVIVDPFTGESNTGIACKNLAKEFDIKFLGYDIDSEYCRMSKNNLS